MIGLIVDYGYDLSASRKIAAIQKTKGDLQEYFRSVVSAKLLIYLCLVILVLLYIQLKDYNFTDFVLFVLLLLSVIGNAFFFFFLFLGLERLDISASIQFVAKFIFSLSILLMISSPDDYALYGVAVFFSQTVLIVISHIYLKRKYSIVFKLASIQSIKRQIQNGFTVFISTFVANFYSTFNLTLLGILTSETEVGYFSASQKIVYFGIGIIGYPLSLTLFPKISQSFVISEVVGRKTHHKYLKLVLIPAFVVSFALFFNAEKGVLLIFGNQFSDSIDLLRVLSPLPFIIAISNYYGTLGLLNMKKDPDFFMVTGIGALLGITLNLSLFKVFGVFGFCVGWLLTEASVSFLMFHRYHYKERNEDQITSY